MRNSTTYKQSGAKTFRLSSSQILTKKMVFEGKRKTKGWGSNLQNIEKGMREIYIPDGFTPSLTEKCLYYLTTRDITVFTEEERASLRIFVQVDQSGAEALIVAYCTVAGQYRELFKCGIKPHSFLGMHLFADKWTEKMREHNLIGADSDFDIQELVNCPVQQLKAHKHWPSLDRLIKDSDNWALTERYYYLAKQTEHSSNYNVGEFMFRMNVLEKSGGKVVIEKDDAIRFLATKFALFPEIKGYHSWVADCARRNKMLYNLHGHPYTLSCPDINDSELKELYAWIPQSTVGEITNSAYATMYDYIRDNNKRWDLLANTHDSYLLQCPVGEEELCATMGQKFMNQEFTSPIDRVKFNMRSEAQYGFNWSGFKKEKNELGLRTI